MSVSDKFRAGVSRCWTQQELKVSDTNLDAERKSTTAGHITKSKLTAATQHCNLQRGIKTS